MRIVNWCFAVRSGRLSDDGRKRLARRPRCPKGSASPRRHVARTRQGGLGIPGAHPRYGEPAALASLYHPRPEPAIMKYGRGGGSADLPHGSPSFMQGRARREQRRRATRCGDAAMSRKPLQEAIDLPQELPHSFSSLRRHPSLA